ncbi:cold shock domain-containing protein [Streptomyces sp. H49]|uniref:cold shock domain-containing protein n=1 Tax=Streptomyces sp. H49 TaxID=3444117 RepID=UPI003F4AD10C
MDVAVVQFAEDPAGGLVIRRPIAFPDSKVEAHVRRLSCCSDRHKKRCLIKGFGFIEQDSGPDFFVRCSEILATGYRSLKEGQRAEYEATKGPQTTGVSII